MNLARELYDTLKDPVDAPEYKRSSARRKVQIPIDIELDGKVCRSVAETRDVTPTSMGILTSLELQDRQRIRVRRDQDSPWSEAVVVHCVGTVGAYKVGLEMSED